VKLGLAKSFAHPGGNATGIAMMTATLTLKRLELIRELLPQNATIGLLVNPDNQDLLYLKMSAHPGRPEVISARSEPRD
jgi:putative ABC transport system substrate-binding protein